VWKSGIRTIQHGNPPQIELSGEGNYGISTQNCSSQIERSYQPTQVDDSIDGLQDLTNGTGRGLVSLIPLVRDSRGSWRIGRRRTGRKTGEHGNGEEKNSSSEDES
jgi:hypothetical protein